MTLSSLLSALAKAGGLSIAGLGINNSNLRDTIGGITLASVFHLIDSIWNSAKGEHAKVA